MMTFSRSLTKTRVRKRRPGPVQVAGEPVDISSRLGEPVQRGTDEPVKNEQEA